MQSGPVPEKNENEYIFIRMLLFFFQYKYELLKWCIILWVTEVQRAVGYLNYAAKITEVQKFESSNNRKPKIPNDS